MLNVLVRPVSGRASRVSGRQHHPGLLEFCSGGLLVPLVQLDAAHARPGHDDRPAERHPVQGRRLDADVSGQPEDNQTTGARDPDRFLQRWMPLVKLGLSKLGAILWLLDDSARFVNGVDLPVDGGILAGRPASVGMPARAAMAAAFKRREDPSNVD